MAEQGSTLYSDLSKPGHLYPASVKSRLVPKVAFIN